MEKVIQSYIPKNEKCRYEEQKNEVQRGKEKQHFLNQIEKVENPAKVELNIDWVAVDPDMSTCSSCKEVVYSGPKKLKIEFNGEELNQRRPIILCEPCFSKI